MRFRFSILTALACAAWGMTATPAERSPMPGPAGPPDGPVVARSADFTTLVAAGSVPSRGVWKTPDVAPRLPEPADREALRASLRQPFDAGDGYPHRGRRIRLLRERDRIQIQLRPGASAEDLRKRLEASDLGRLFSVRLEAGPFGERSRLLRIEPRPDLSAAEPEQTVLDLALGLPDRLRADPAVRSARPVLVEAATGVRAVAASRLAIRLRGNLPVTPSGGALHSRPGGPFRSPAPTDSAALSLLERLERLCGARRGDFLGEGTWLFELADPGADAVAAAAAVNAAALPGVLWAEPDLAFPVDEHFLPDDPYFEFQQHLRNTGQNFGTPGADVGAAGAWDYTRGDSSITIAVVDDGIQRTHPDLRIKAGGRNYVPATPTDNPDPEAATDDHGTLVAGVAAGRGNNALGGSGMAPLARVLPLKIATGGQWALNSNIAKALRYAVDTGGADVINNSWGGGMPNSLVADAIVHASRNGRGGRGTPVVFSSGNSASDYRSLYYPLWQFSPPIPSGRYRIGFRYKRDGSGSAGEHLASIDGYAIRGPDGYTVVERETFASGLPSGWTAPATNPATPPWVATTAMHYPGTGDGWSLRSPGGLAGNEAAEILAPLRGFDAGEALQLKLRLLSAPGDTFIVSVYDSAGNVVGTAEPEIGETAVTVDSLAFPADADSVIAVGASTELDFRSGYSQYRVSGSGRSVTLVAPSNGAWNGVTTTDRTGADGISGSDYTIGFGGTSASAPLASGVMALVLSRRPDLTRDQLLDAIKAACDKIGNVAYAGGVHREYGHGRINARRTLEILDRAPVLAPVGNKAVGEGATLAFNLSAVDPDGDAVVFSGLDLPAGAAIVGSGFAWTPGPAQAGNHALRLVARAHALADTESIVITVGDADSPPGIAAVADTAIEETRNLHISVTAVEPDGEPIEWSWLGGPPGASFQAGSFSWTPTFADSGLYTVRFIARSGTLSDTEEVRIHVRNLDRPPVLSVPGPLAAGEGQYLEFPVSASDPDADAVLVAAPALPPGASFDGSSFRWRPGYDRAGTYGVRFYAVSGNLVDSQDVAITVQEGGSGTGFLRLASAPGTEFLAMPAADGPGSTLGRDTVIFEAAVGTYFFTARRPGFRPARFAARVRSDTLFDVPVRLKPHIPRLAGPPVPLSLDGAALAGLDLGAAAADLDYDGRQDLVVLGPSGPRFLKNVAPGDSAEGRYSASTAVGFAAAAFADIHAFTVDDWDDDGWLDLLVARRDGRVMRVSPLTAGAGDTVPVYRDTALLVDRPGKTCHPHVSDRDGDGRKDLHLLCAQDGLWIYRNTGSASAPALAAAPQEVRSEDGSALANLASPVWLDFDGDGNLDFLAFQDGRLKAFLARPGAGNGTGGMLAFAPGQAVNVAGSELDCSACKLALRPLADGAAYLLSFEPGRPAEAHRFRLLGDLNGDGKVDAADRVLLLGAWESRDTDPAWNPGLNLALDPERYERIDVRDLGAFGDSWGLED